MLLAFRKSALVFFGVFGAYLISIYLGLWFNMGFSLLVGRAPDFFMKYVAVPLALEGGMGAAAIILLYMLGRFVELRPLPTVIFLWVGLHVLDALMQWMLGAFTLSYGEPQVLALRLPGFILFGVAGWYVLRAALRRGRS